MTDRPRTDRPDGKLGLFCVLWNLIRPPKVDASPQLQHAWRWRVVFFGTVLGIVAAVPYARDMGKIPFLSPYATLADLQKAVSDDHNLDTAALDKVSNALASLTTELQTEIAQRMDDRASVLDQQLYSLWVARCATHDVALEIADRNRIADLEIRYEKAAGKPYTIQMCSQL